MNGATAAAGEVSAMGAVSHTEYLGPVSRHTVALDLGADLFVLEQNSGATPVARAGSRVTVAFDAAAAVPIGD